MIKKVAVLGAGHGGFALAFHLTHRGFEVALFSHPNHKHAIEAVQETGHIVAVAEERGHKAALSGTAKVALATTDIQAAVEFGEVVIVVVPAFGQMAIFESALPYLKTSQIFVSTPGKFASLQYVKTILDRGSETRPIFVDTASIPYACRKLLGNQVFIGGHKKMMRVGVFPTECGDEVLEKLQPLFTVKLSKVNNVMTAGFANISMILHPPVMLQNTGWIEHTGGKFCFYSEGCTPSVCRVMEAMDQERLAVAACLGVETDNVMNSFRGLYGYSGKNSIYEYIHFSSVHAFLLAPPSLQHRFVDEDMCYVLVPMAKLGNSFGVATPVIDSVVKLTEVMTEKRLEAKRGFELVVKPGESLTQMHQRLSNWM